MDVGTTRVHVGDSSRMDGEKSFGSSIRASASRFWLVAALVCAIADGVASSA